MVGAAAEAGGRPKGDRRAPAAGCRRGVRTPPRPPRPPHQLVPEAAARLDRDRPVARVEVRHLWGGGRGRGRGGGGRGKAVQGGRAAPGRAFRVLQAAWGARGGRCLRWAPLSLPYLSVPHRPCPPPPGNGVAAPGPCAAPCPPAAPDPTLRAHRHQEGGPHNARRRAQAGAPAGAPACARHGGGGGGARRARGGAAGRAGTARASGAGAPGPAGCAAPQYPAAGAQVLFSASAAESG
jgi:hypothetical protein